MLYNLRIKGCTTLYFQGVFGTHITVYDYNIVKNVHLDEGRHNGF